MDKKFLNESMTCEAIVTGEEIANRVGMGNAYRKSKQMEENGLAMKEGIKSKFANLTDRMDKAPKGIECNFD